MAKPCTPRPIPQAEQFFKPKAVNVGGRGELPSRSLGGFKGYASRVYYPRYGGVFNYEYRITAAKWAK